MFDDVHNDFAFYRALALLGQTFPTLYIMVESVRDTEEGHVNT